MNATPILLSPAERSAMQQQHIQQLYLSVYVPLVPVITAKFLDKKAMADKWQQDNDEELPQAIANEVARIAKACMKPLGITMQ